ncbi:hypothetical protein [Fusobacterium sp.]|uniref:hypothetical protein n=1 Tax=Fusobacterium sp. TaxID=68766 RepID=UPI0029035D38|nr:hypothetical protein [Fusobacterium sp.]MDU1912517.1 hypothetical protein [Fusobacterium sp.]
MSTIKNAIESFIGTDEEKKRQRELLTLLADASENKAEVMENEIQTYIRTAGTVENKTIPVDDILSFYKEIRVITEDSMGDIVEKIKESIKDILNGNILDGVTNIIGVALNKILGSSSGSEQNHRQYFVCVEGLSMVRYDISYWARSITVETLKKSAEKSLVCIMTKSTIDAKKLKFNTFLNIYQSLLDHNKEIKPEELAKYIEQAKEIYKELVDNDEIYNSSIRELAINKIDNISTYLTTYHKESNPATSWPEIK